MNTISKGFQQEKDFNDIILNYSKRWYWFLLAILFFVGIGFLYNRYAVPKYDLTAKIQILEEKGASSELAVFKDLDFLGGKQNEVEDEIEVLNSRSNFIEVVKNLKANITYNLVGDIKESELYGDNPININFLSPDSLLFNAKHVFHINLSSKNNFEFRNDNDNSSNLYSFGKNIKTPVGDIIITPNLEHYDRYKGQDVKVIISPVTVVAQNFKKMVKISTIDEFSKILTLSIEHPIPNKGERILNSLISVYNNNAVLDKKEIADRTFKFINDRISDIYSNLSTVDQTAQEFKTDRGLTDIRSQANINLNVGAANQQELENYRNQLNIAGAMREIVEDQNQSNETLPSNIGLSDPSIANSTAKYNQLLQERNRLLKSSNEKNPVIVGLDQELQSLKNGLKASLGAMENNLSLTVNNLSRQQSRINSKIYSAPTNERALRDITRKQETTESLYLYLLQRREESQVALASTAPKSKVIDSAYLTDDRPISPNKFKVYLACFIMGLLVPFTLIYTKDLLDNKVHSKSMLEKIIGNYPVLAELPKIDKKSKKHILEDDRSVLSESLRILRTNLDYLIKSKKTDRNNNVILVTSSISGEGKTFVSSNLSMIFASTKKKVLLIGADIRNPKLTEFFVEDKNVDALGKNKNSNLGLSDYLLDSKVSSSDIVKSMLVHSNTVDVIYSGKILPNPSELLMGERFKNLIEEVSSSYDYVIIDSAPLMLVTDTLLISPYANHTIYVTRAHFTETKVVDFPISLQEEGKLKGLNFVVNDVKENNLGYGGKYGYGYGVKVKKWWQLG